MKAVAAVDLGATSGRVMLGYVGHDELRLVPVSRFPNGPVDVAGSLHWNVSGLFDHAVAGIATAARQEPELAGIGIDSWAVDYGLLCRGRLLAEPFHYRDERTAAGVSLVHRAVAPEELYAANGLQHLPFNTLFQLAEDAAAGRLSGVDSFLLIPDLLGFWLTGRQFAERTNASTTGLLSPVTGQWDDALIGRLGLPHAIFPELISAGSTVGELLPEMAGRIGLDGLTVSAVGSHDTASAVVAVPAADDDFAYISCGTWGLVGVELESPILSEAGRLANFTNEGGLDGRVRYLHNVMGLWILSESVRTWEAEGDTISLPELLAAASAVTAPVTVFDANDPRFSPPGDLPARIAEWCVEYGEPVPAGRAEFVRSIIESLAAAFAEAVRTAASLSGKRISVIHMVGGGSQNALLCQLVADRSELPVLAGPVEATAVGNVLVQARAQGFITGSLESMRSLVSRAFEPVAYSPR